MHYKKLIKNFLSPFSISLILRLKNYIGLYEWKFVGYEWKPTYNGSGKAWDIEDIAKLQDEKWEAYKDMLEGSKPLGINHEAALPYENENIFFHNLLLSFSYVAALSVINKKQINFLDWGGGIGHYGQLIHAVLPSNVAINYYCYDNKYFCEAGRKLNIKNAVFFHERERFLVPDFYDLIVASSSLWYEADWERAFVSLTQATKKYLYITRMAFTKGRSYVAMQKPAYMGYDTSYYFWVISEDELKELALKSNLTLVREFVFKDVSRIYKASQTFQFKGFLFEKK